MDLDHVRASAAEKAAASAAASAAKAVRTRPASAARQANAEEAGGADADYSPGGVLLPRRASRAALSLPVPGVNLTGNALATRAGAMHPRRAQASAAAALAAAEQDRRQHQKIERDRAIMGAKAPTTDLAQLPSQPSSSLAAAIAARQANELQAGGYA